MTTKNIFLGFFVVLSVLLVALVINRDHQIAELKIEHKAYKEQKERLSDVADSLRGEIKASNKRIIALTEKLNEIPTDEEVVNNNPVQRVTVNDSWRSIIEPIGRAVDSIQVGHGAISD